MQYTHTYEALVAVTDAESDELTGLACTFQVVASLLEPLKFDRPLILSVGEIPENDSTFGFPVPHFSLDADESCLHLVERFVCTFLQNAVSLEQAGEQFVLHATNAQKVGVVVLTSHGESPVIAESPVYTARRSYSREEYVEYVKTQQPVDYTHLSRTAVQALKNNSLPNVVQTLRINPVQHVLRAFVG